MLATLCACALTLSAGLAQLSAPNNGTWWNAGDQASFDRVAPSFGIGLTGDNWSLLIEKTGRESSSSFTPGSTDDGTLRSHWYGTQRPIGLWGAWEPHYGRLFGQIGAGVYWPRFDMRVPDFVLNPTYGVRVPLSVGNNRAEPGGLIGAGYAVTDRVQIVANLRTVRAIPRGTNPAAFAAGDFDGLAKTAITITLRLRL